MLWSACSPLMARRTSRTSERGPVGTTPVDAAENCTAVAVKAFIGNMIQCAVGFAHFSAVLSVGSVRAAVAFMRSIAITVASRHTNSG